MLQMDIKDLNRSQLILLALLLSFVTSLATGITTVTLMQQVPDSVTVPITKVVKQTVEKIVPNSSSQALSEEEKKLLEELKFIQSLYVTVSLTGEDKNEILGTGFMMGNDKVVVNSVIPAPEENQSYTTQSVFGERKVISVQQQEDYTVLELEKKDNLEETENLENNNN